MGGTEEIPAPALTPAVPARSEAQAASKAGCRAVGIEIDDALVAESRRAASLTAFSDRIDVLQVRENHQKQPLFDRPSTPVPERRQ